MPGVLSPGCPHRTPPSPSRSFTPSSKRPPTSRCAPLSSPSSRWVSSLGTVGFMAAFRHRGFGGGFGAAHVPPGTRVSPPHVWSHTGPGLVAIKQGVGPAGCHLKFIKNSLFFLNLPFNSMLTLQSPHSRGICPVLAMLALPADVCARCPLSLVSKGIIKKCKTLFHLCIPSPRAGAHEWRSTLIAGICGVVCCRLSWSGTAEPPPLLSSLQHFWDARSRER